MDVKNLAKEVLDDTQPNSIGNATNCMDDMVWTPKAISILLKIFQDKLMMLTTLKKKTRIWIIISICLKRHNIKVTPEAVRGIFNELAKRYKLCLDGDRPEQFKYFKEMDKIYAMLNADQNDTIAEITQKTQSNYNIRSNAKTKDKTCQEKEAIIEIGKKILANSIEPNSMQDKSLLNKQWLEYLKRREDQNLSRDQNHENNEQVREEELGLQDDTSKINECSEYRKMLMWIRKHETLLRIEIEKFEMLKKMSSF